MKSSNLHSNKYRSIGTLEMKKFNFDVSVNVEYNESDNG